MKHPVITPVSGKTNVEIVVEQLEKLIRGGYWEPEERIWSEAELCAKFNVGRSTIREAVNMLKAKNLLYTVSGLGTFVTKASDVDGVFVVNHIPDPKSEADLLNIMELRLGLEPVNAALAAKRALPEEVEALRFAHEERQRLTGLSTRSFAENDMEFHMLLAQASHNPITLDVMNMVTHFFLEQQILTSHQESRRRKSMKYHGQILDAVSKQQVALAEGVMREHMEDTYEHVRSLINISKRISGRLPLSGGM